MEEEEPTSIISDELFMAYDRELLEIKPKAMREYPEFVFTPVSSLDTKAFGSVRIVCKESKSFYIDKRILSSNSSIFSTLLNQRELSKDLEENDGIETLNVDEDPVVLSFCLSLMFTDFLVDVVTDKIREFVNSKLFQDSLVCCEKYGFEKLNHVIDCMTKMVIILYYYYSHSNSLIVWYLRY
jgi:hypothetical protein